MMNVAVDVDTPAGKISHLCELQIHLTAIKKSEPMHKITAYEFFRSFFLGNAEAVEQRLDMFCALPVDDVNDADELDGPRARVRRGREITRGTLCIAHVNPGVCGRREGPGSYLWLSRSKGLRGEQGGGRGAV